MWRFYWIEYRKSRDNQHIKTQDENRLLLAKMNDIPFCIIFYFILSQIEFESTNYESHSRIVYCI